MLHLTELAQKIEPLLSTIDIELILHRRRRWKATLPLHLLLAAVLWFNFSGMTCFKHYVSLLLPQMLSRYRLSYSRWAWWRQRLLPVVAVLAEQVAQRKRYRGLSFIDSTALPVCGIQRERDHKTFQKTAAKSRSSLGWFHGLKLHLVTSETGQMLRVWLTAGNTHDVSGPKKPGFLDGISGRLIGDSGYQSRAQRRLFVRRWRIETVIGQLKDRYGLRQVRSCRNAASLQVLVYGALIAYNLAFAKRLTAIRGSYRTN